MRGPGGEPLEFRVLGPLRVLVDGEERPVPGEKLQALLARLLLEPNRPVPTERLIDDLWGEEPPATARQALHVHVGRLRRLLANGGPDPSRLVSDGRGYLLRVDPDRVDATRFRRLVDEARAERRAGTPASAAERYRDALGLWRGSALEGVELERADGERADLEDLRLAALEERIDADLALGAAAELVPELEQLVRAEPLRERLHAQRMLALYAAGRQADGLAAYQDARRALGELGLEPGPRLRELEQAILRQDPSLVTAPLGAPAARPRRAGVGRTVGAALTLAAAIVVAVVVAAARDDPPGAAARPTPPRVVPNSVVGIDPATNAVESVIQLGEKPDRIAATKDALWVANFGDRTISRVDLPTGRVRTVGGAPVALTVAATLKGDVWVSSFEEPYVSLVARGGRVGGNGVVTAGPPRVRVPGSAEGLAVGGGFLWVTSPRDSGGDNTVSRIDLRTRRLVSSVPVGSLPLYVAFGYGSAWVSNYRNATVSVVRPGSERAESVTVGDGPLGIAAGAGAIWVVTFWKHELVRIDPETRRVVGRTRVGADPLAVAVGAGAVWVTNRGDRTVSRVDPETGRLEARIRLAAVPYDVRVAGGRVWVTTQACGVQPGGC